MLRTAALLIATFLTAVTHAATAAEAPPYEITEMQIGKVMGGNVTFVFTVYDPDPLTNATSTCEGEWVTASKDFPTGGYEQCNGNTTFAWNMQEFNTVKSFTLGIEHTYVDPAVGQAPYNTITNFGKVKVDPTNFPCTVDGDSTTCKQKDALLEAPIYATMAKKR